jgi:hypothetical protein
MMLLSAKAGGVGLNLIGKLTTNMVDNIYFWPFTQLHCPSETK